MDGSKPRMSKLFFLASILGLIVVNVLLLISFGIFVLFQTTDKSRADAEGWIVAASAALVVVLGLSFLYEVVVTCLLVHQMWSAIQDGQARTTPGKAVGFLFIPFYSLYWVFVAYRGFAQNYNALLERRQLTLPRLPIGLYTAFAVLTVTAGIPYLGCLALLPIVVVFPILAAKTCDAVNALPEIQPKPPETMTREEHLQAAQQRKTASTPGWVWAIVAAGAGLFLIMLIGIVAAIAIPSLLVEKEKEAVQKTMRDMSTLSVAMESYSIDFARYPQAANVDELVEILRKENFVINQATRDAWGNAFIVEVQPDARHYCIISRGQNGIREAQEPYSALPQENPQRGADIVLVDGVFVSCPARVHR
jgi:type II secretory pathway pseudopilin PulG